MRFPRYPLAVGAALYLGWSFAGMFTGHAPSSMVMGLMILAALFLAVMFATRNEDGAP